MRSFSYPAVLTPEKEGGFMVRFPDLPEAITSGTGREEALMQAADCLKEAIAGRIVDGLDIPMPFSCRRPRVLVPVPAPMAAKAALYLAIGNSGLSNVQLARRLSCDEKEIRRMLDPRHPAKLSRIQRALDALGQRLVVGVEEAA